LILRMDNLLAGNLIPPFRKVRLPGRYPAPPALGLWKSFRDQADHESGIGR